MHPFLDGSSRAALGLHLSGPSTQTPKVNSDAVRLGDLRIQTWMGFVLPPTSISFDAPSGAELNVSGDVSVRGTRAANSRGRSRELACPVGVINGRESTAKHAIQWARARSRLVVADDPRLIMTAADGKYSGTLCSSLTPSAYLHQSLCR